MPLFTPMLLGHLPASIHSRYRMGETWVKRVGLPTTADQRRCEAHGLTGGTPGKAPRPLRLESPHVFFVPGEPRTRRVFQRDAAGRVTGFVERREPWDLVWKRAD